MRNDIPKRVLIVDDDATGRGLVAEALRAAGWQTRECPDGSSLSPIINDFNPTVVFLDLRMPKKLGVDVLRELKIAFPWLQVVILTGHGDENDAISCLNLGACHYLRKPSSIKDLTSSCEDARAKVPLALWAFHNWYKAQPDPKKLVYKTASGDELSAEKLMEEVSKQTETGRLFMQKIMEVAAELIIKRLK